MKKSDIGMCTAVYLIVIAFFAMVMQYDPEVRIYPVIVMVAIFLLNTAYFVKCLIAYAKEKKVENDYKTMFENFLPKQFFFILLGSLLYIVLISLVGFYPATILYLIGILFFLKVRGLYIAITVIAFACVIYGAFSKFLHVPLPGSMFF